MQRIILALFFALVTVPNMATAEENAVTKKNMKSFDLDVSEEAIMNESIPGDLCCGDHDFDYYSEPSAGEDNLVQQMKIAPEFRYEKPQDYNSRLNVYDTEVKVNMSLPVDLY